MASLNGLLGSVDAVKHIFEGAQSAPTGRFSGVRRRDLNFELWFQKLEHFGVFLHLFSFPVR